MRRLYRAGSSSVARVRLRAGTSYARRDRFGYVFALAMIRASGKRTIRQGDTHSFLLAVIIGDLFDDLFWAEVAAAQFVVALSTLVMLHVLASVNLHVSGRRTWRREPVRSGA